ncbi:MAG TPA: phage tail sheath C-terminal domain-containing protein [Pyrinomonadaceae bacterium]|nr:phage tail sheath C-terminal domain-containing protein [Pyrinomonadaceae bacterium]
MSGEYLAPGVYVQEVPTGGHPIEGVSTSGKGGSTSSTAFIDIFQQGPLNKAVQITSFAEFERAFGGLDARSEAGFAIQQYYLNGGRIAWVVRVDDNAGAEAIVGDTAAQTGMYALEGIAPNLFNILCIPAAANLDQNSFTAVVSAAEKYCLEKRAFLIVDIPSTINTKDKMLSWMETNDCLRHRNAAIYFPRLEIPDPLNEGRLREVGASGTLAGVYARTDETRGVWKASAGADAGLRGANVTVQLNDSENGALNALGINALRNFSKIGNVSWGARTLDGSDQEASDWKYIPVRRTALYLEESLYQGSKWANFEPNDELLWSQIRLSFGAFMTNLLRLGAFQGTKAGDAFFIKCDGTTTTQDDIARGIVNIIVGFAPLKPAEFVVIYIQQIAGRIGT